MKDKLLYLIAALGLSKLLIHFLTNTNYGLHRDEFLYWDEGNHLAWGFMETPPVTPFIASLSSFLFGDSIFAIRLFPALTGVLTIILIAWMIRDLGGKTWAILFGGLGFLLSLAFLHCNTLFQPVTFNQFFWFLSAFLLIRLVKTEDKKYWYFLGLAFGFGILTKYSIAFYGIGLFIGLLFSKQRQWLRKPQPYLSLFIALLIASPNLLWQFQHKLPVVQHMQELSEQQLVHVDLLGFFTDQLLFHFSGLVVWLSGLYYLLFKSNYREYRFIGVAFLSTVLLIALLRGKSYYTIGAFTPLFIFGGLALEQLVTTAYKRIALLAILILFTLPMLPYSLPLLPSEQMKVYGQFMAEHAGLQAHLKWEDGNYYSLPQDYADMNGWEELAQKVSKHYHQLSEKEQQNCHILGGSYGHAGSLNYYREKYQLPEVHSFNGSYMIWSPAKIEYDRQFMIVEEKQDSSTWFKSMILVDSIENPNARDKGYIYYRTLPRRDVSEAWEEAIMEEKERFNFK